MHVCVRVSVCVRQFYATQRRGRSGLWRECPCDGTLEAGGLPSHGPLFCLLETLWQQRLMKCFLKVSDSKALNTASTEGPIKNTQLFKNTGEDPVMGRRRNKLSSPECVRTCTDPYGYNHDGLLSQNALFHTTFVFMKDVWHWNAYNNDSCLSAILCSVFCLFWAETEKKT